MPVTDYDTRNYTVEGRYKYRPLPQRLFNWIEVNIRRLIIRFIIGPEVDSAIVKMIARLESSDYLGKVVAARDLARMQERAFPSIPFLIKHIWHKTGTYSDWPGLGDGPVWLHVEASKAIVAVGSDAVPILKDELFRKVSPDELIGSGYDMRDLRTNATWCLGQIDDPSVVDLLCTVLEKYGFEWDMAARKAEEALRRIGGQKAMDCLRNASEEDEKSASDK